MSDEASITDPLKAKSSFGWAASGDVRLPVAVEGDVWIIDRSQVMGYRRQESAAAWNARLRVVDEARRLSGDLEAGQVDGQLHGPSTANGCPLCLVVARLKHVLDAYDQANLG